MQEPKYRVSEALVLVLGSIYSFMSRENAVQCWELDQIVEDLTCAIEEVRDVRATLTRTLAAASAGTVQPCLFCGEVH